MFKALVAIQGGDPGHDLGDSAPDDAIWFFIQNHIREAVEAICEAKGIATEGPGNEVPKEFAAVKAYVMKIVAKGIRNQLKLGKAVL